MAISLRELQEKDAEYMLEWMHDKSVVEHLQTDFSSKTLDNCINFIRCSKDEKNIHLAIVDESDEYQGTVSLKNIHDGTAEFAITIRKCAMGKGCSKIAMEKIIQYGKENLGLKVIYWCVSPENKRAVRFYDKNGYQHIDLEKIKEYCDGYTEEQLRAYDWYIA